MIAAEARSIDITSNKSKATSYHLKSAIPSKLTTPVPPSSSQHGSVTRRKTSTYLRSSTRGSRKSDALKSNNPHFKNLGLEVKPEQVVWKGWEPGEEYTRNLTLKNVNVKTQKIRYKAPSSRFFSTLFPQVIVLSAGTSFSLPITFRPLDKERYEDKIEFSTGNGDFAISLQALLPETNLQLPEGIHFGLSAVHDTVELTFQIKNMSSELSTSFSWDVPGPFTILPPTGMLPPKATCLLKAIFSPKSAQVFQACVVCMYGENMVKTMSMEGIGKYPHLLISGSPKQDGESNLIEFGSVNIHTAVEKHVVLQNLSNVKASFKVNRLSSTVWMDEAFNCMLRSGCVPPMGNVHIPIKFEPHIAGQISTDYFEVCAHGDISKSTLKCTGTCQGPVVELSTPLISFGIVAPGVTLVRSIKMINQSSCVAYYQILLDTEHGVFCVSDNSGVLSPLESKTLLFRFTPPCSINFHRKVTVLVHDQGPLFLDLFGTSHDEHNKPPVLKPEHLTRYQTHVTRGLSFFPPDVLHTQHREGRLLKDRQGCFILPNDEDGLPPPMQSNMDQYFDDGHTTQVTHNPPHVSLDKMSIFLGQVQFDRSIQPACHVTVQMTNHTRGKVTAVWVTDPMGVFEVTPPTCDVPAMKSTDFRVNFNPTNPNQLYGKQLECYVSYKCQRDYRLVEESAVSPPWLLTVDVSAHTFNGSNETFLPDTLICTNQLSFGPVLTSHNSYRTILLENKSNAPLLHHFIKNPSSAFTIKPSEGLVKSRFHISTLRLVPDRVEAYTGAVTLRLNDNPIHDQVLQLSGSGEQPELLLSNNGEFFFRPTCVGTVNKGKYQVQNVGRLPLQFKWVLKHSDAEGLSVEPLEGVIQPNEIQYHTWSFQPNSVKKYVCKPTCFTWAGSTQVARDAQDVRDARKFIVRVVGEGTEGDIKCETSSVYFGCVIAGSCTPEKLVLYNDSQCDLHYRLHIDQCVNSQYGEDPDENEPIGLKLSQSEGVISTRSKTLITAIANPYRRVLYSWALYYELLNPAGESINPNSKILLCELGAEGVYPTLAVIDARTSGSGSSIGKTQLWRWFNLEQFNSCLDSDPQPAELMYSVNTRHSTSRRPSVYTKSILGFNFGAASVDSEPCHVSLMVNNTGSVNTEWAFLLPKDLELEMEYWAESGEFDKDELHELHIQDNELFTVTPNKGTLRAGESKMIVLTYKHDVPGTHRLPVLFKIEHGKEVLLNFIGVTVEPSRRYLHFPGTQHTFTPIPIGGPTPPKQLYEMFNGGAVALIYEVDTAPLHELQSSNYDHPILTCINPRGEILPGSSANLEWIFSPLESKTYTVDIPIHVVGGETALITFKAIGYDSRALGATMPITDQPLEFTTVPSQQKVPVPGQLLFLSEERIGFGNVPLFSRSRHIIFLNNKSTERPLSYSWHAASDVVNDVLRIEPVQGYLQPGESAMTKVTFCAAGQPSFYDLDLICEVVDEIKLADYRSELTAWEAERERQLVEFTITDDDYDVIDGRSNIGQSTKMISPRRNLENVLNSSRPPLKLTESQLSCSISKAEHKSYQTLPPIRFEDPVKLPSNRSRLLRKDEQVATDEWVQPQPPAPFIFHLGVTARTHDIAEYRSNFPHSSTKHYIDRTLQINCPTATKSPRDQYSLSICNEEENEMIVSVMSNIIRGLLDDPTFQEAAKEAGSESIPYFPQLAREEDDLGLEVVPPQTGGEFPQAEVVLPQTVGNLPQTQGESPQAEGEPPQTQGDTPQTEGAHHVDMDESEDRTSPKQLMDEILKQGEGSRPQSSDSTTKSPRVSEGICSSLPVSTTLKRMQEQEIRRSPMFGGILEELLSSTLSNIMEEALSGEVILTARPRVVALPPSRVQSATNRPPSLTPSRKSDSATSRRQRSHGGSSNGKSRNSAKQKK